MHKFIAIALFAFIGMAHAGHHSVVDGDILNRVADVLSHGYGGKVILGYPEKAHLVDHHSSSLIPAYYGHGHDHYGHNNIGHLHGYHNHGHISHGYQGHHHGPVYGGGHLHGGYRSGHLHYAQAPVVHVAHYSGHHHGHAHHGSQGHGYY